MNLQEQHWTNLFGHLTSEGSPWYGVWKAYSPEQTVLKSSQGIRILQANEDHTVITHTNQFPLPDGSKTEKQWQIEKETSNHPDGLAHPADVSKRALSLSPGGATAWVPKKLEVGKPFSVELFLKHQDRNSSIGSIYTENGDLEKILHLREQLGSFPEPSERPIITALSGQWMGKKQTMKPDLSLSSPEAGQELIFDPTLGKNKTFCLPDSVIVTIPQKLPIGEAFEIIAGKLFTDDEYTRFTVKYDSSGTFSELISEVFHLQAH